MQGSNIVPTTISIPVCKDHVQIGVKLDGTPTYKFSSKNFTTLKMVIMFLNDGDDAYNVEALSKVNYQYVRKFVVDGKSKVGWYGVFDNATNELKFNVKNLKTNYNLKVSITNIE